MSKRYRDYGLSLLLLAASGLLAGALLLEWTHFRGERADLASRMASKAEVKQESIANKEETYTFPDIEEYSQMTERPLFIEGRHPPEGEEAPVESNIAHSPLTLKLMGVVVTPRDKTALLVDARGKYKRARKNTVVDGWKLVDIGQDKVTLAQGDEQTELKLLKPKPKTAAPLKPGKVAARAKGQVNGDETGGSGELENNQDGADESADENTQIDEATDEDE